MCRVEDILKPMRSKNRLVVLFWVVARPMVMEAAVRKYKHARNGMNRVTPKCQVLTLIVITIAAISAKAGHSRDGGPDIHGVL